VGFGHRRLRFSDISIISNCPSTLLLIQSVDQHKIENVEMFIEMNCLEPEKFEIFAKNHPNSWVLFGQTKHPLAPWKSPERSP
jgi:hypothetical protein